MQIQDCSRPSTKIGREIRFYWRSSQVICNTTFKLSTLETESTAVTEIVKDYDYTPELMVFDSNKIQETIDKFLAKCSSLNIEVSQQNVAVVCRSKTFVSRIIGLPELENFRWTEDFGFTYHFVHSIFLFQKGLLRQAFKLMELTILKKIKNLDFLSQQEISDHIEKYGFVKHRSFIYSVLRKFPKLSGTIGEWVTASNEYLKRINLKLEIIETISGSSIEKLFMLDSKDIPNLKFTAGTVHSVKGETYEAVLLFLKTKGLGKNYTTFIKESASVDDEEELRIVYVGLTRAQKLLMIALPDEKNRAAWQSKLGL